MQPTLISPEDFAAATHLQKFKFAAKALMSFTKVVRVNELYSRAANKSQDEFVDEILKEINIHYDIDLSELAKIPKNGPFISISNHPLGAIDGLLLLKILRSTRKDFKVMANFLLQHIEPIEELFIPVNPFDVKKVSKSSTKGVLSSFKHLKSGGSLGIFPAGEVSSFSTKKRQIIDCQWNTSILKFIKKAEVPIVPIYFEGHNSMLFQLLGLIHPSLRTLALPSEMLKKKNSTIKVRIGSPIKVAEQKEWEDIDQFGRYLRAKTYCLGSALEVKPYFANKAFKRVSTISLKEEISQEIESIKDHLVCQQQEFQVYLSSAELIPKCLQEIGKLREETFQKVGEGTNKEIDLDEYDLYYHHLILWDNENKKIAGAYRIGKGDEIFSLYGKKGFYTQSLFKINDHFFPYLKKSLELGRSFVVEEYQKKRLPLYLLWRGILEILTKNTQYRYLIGPVSISNNYSSLSRMLLVSFIRANYFREDLAKFIKPRKEFKVKFKKVEGDALLKSSKNDIKKIDHIIQDIEPNHAPIPVLVKKYLKQNAKIIGFNLDPKFNKALDGLIFLDLKDVPGESIEQLKSKLN